MWDSFGNVLGIIDNSHCGTQGYAVSTKNKKESLAYVFTVEMDHSILLLLKDYYPSAFVKMPREHFFELV